MGSINYRPAGLNIQTTIPAGGLNDAFVDVQEVLLLETGNYRRNRLNTLDIPEEPTLQEWWGDPTKTDKEIWDLAVAAGYKVNQLSINNVMAVTTAIEGVTDADVYRAKFIGNNIAEIRRDKGLTEFIAPATSAYPIYRASGWNPLTPAYDDTTGTALSRIVGLGTYFIGIIECGLEDQTLPAPLKIKETGISFNDFYPTDFGSGLRAHAYVKNVSGTPTFREEIQGNNATGGSLVIEEGRKLWSLSAQSPSNLLIPSAGGSEKEIMLAVAGKSWGTPALRLRGNYSSAAISPEFHPHKIAKSNGTDLITLNTSASYWTVSGDGYFISIIILNTNKTATYADGPVWAKGVSDANALVTAGVKAYTNKNGALQIQTIGAGLTAVADTIATVGWNGNLFLQTANPSSTQKTAKIIHAYKTTFTDQDIQNIYDHCKRIVTAQ